MPGLREGVEFALSSISLGGGGLRWQVSRCELDGLRPISHPGESEKKAPLSSWASSAHLGTSGAEIFALIGGLNPSRVATNTPS